MEEEYIKYEKENAIHKKQTFYIIIPVDLLEDKILTSNEKLLYGLITSYCNKSKQCFASNNRLARQLNCGITTISKGVSKLKEQGWINVNIVYKDNSKEIKNRIITLAIIFKKQMSKQEVLQRLPDPMEM